MYSNTFFVGGWVGGWVRGWEEEDRLKGKNERGTRCDEREEEEEEEEKEEDACTHVSILSFFLAGWLVLGWAGLVVVCCATAAACLCLYGKSRSLLLDRPPPRPRLLASLYGID